MPEYRLKIDVFTPETLPMQRLSLYMAELAKLLGEPERVHFVEVAWPRMAPLASFLISGEPRLLSSLDEPVQSRFATALSAKMVSLKAWSSVSVGRTTRCRFGCGMARPFTSAPPASK